MKLSAKLRLIGFIMCCGGIIGIVIAMYQLKLFAVDQVPLGLLWYVNWGWVFISPLVGGQLLLRASQLAKMGK